MILEHTLRLSLRWEISFSPACLSFRFGDLSQSLTGWISPFTTEVTLRPVSFLPMFLPTALRLHCLWDTCHTHTDFLVLACSCLPCLSCLSSAVTFNLILGPLSLYFGNDVFLLHASISCSSRSSFLAEQISSFPADTQTACPCHAYLHQSCCAVPVPRFPCHLSIGICMRYFWLLWKKHREQKQLTGLFELTIPEGSP